jgi:pyruvate-ferredoxin/flavodoxin oxidoreductase
MNAARLTIDGNEAAARMAYLASELIAIYPITPASPMGEFSDQWAAEARPNLWGAVPRIIEMQSEGGAAGVLHGALTSGAMATSFTASQGLLLMIPNLYKIAGELTPFVLHVTARALATHALSIFADHGDVMAVRGTGCALLCANSVQEAQDMALIAHAATLAGRVPVVHFFDGFRTSHEVATIDAVQADTVAAMLDPALVAAHRARALSPEHPVVRGTSQNPDVFFQSRERANPVHRAFPGHVQAAMDRFATLTGRHYHLFDYVGAADAGRVIVLMGSGAETVHETVDALCAAGESVGVLKVRLFRPFDTAALLAALPASTRAVAVLERCKEPGADGEPLYKDVLTALATAAADGTRVMPTVIGGRYGLGSKEFTPAMVLSVFDELAQARPRREITLGIEDDVTGLSLPWDADWRNPGTTDTRAAVFWGLGADGTVSANKNSIKIISKATGMRGQGYFVYDSKKSGAVTVSHLRFGPAPIRSAYLVAPGTADFVACHQPLFLERYDLLEHAAPGATFLLNTQQAPDAVWDSLPRALQQAMLDKGIQLYVIDAYAVAEKAGLGRRINTIMQTCYFAIAELMPRDAAIRAIKAAVEKSYAHKDAEATALNNLAIDMALEHLHSVALPKAISADHERPPAVPPEAPAWVRQLTGEMIAGHGDALPVSRMPLDGTYPVGTAAWEKRNIALEIPEWDADLCSQCGKCVLVCPHTAIRARAFPAEAAEGAPKTFKHVPARSKDFPVGTHMSYQVAPEDCTGCGVCVDACPIHDKANPDHRALNMVPQAPLREPERDNLRFFLGLPAWPREQLKHATIPGAMLLDPCFEYPGACSGCGETPYIRLATQLFGDRMLVANATGCSSIFGGNLPTTPYTTNAEGRGPAWSNSLFEDNAEFGLGMRLASNHLMTYARQLVRELAGEIGGDLAQALLEADQHTETGITAQRRRVTELNTRLSNSTHPQAGALAAVAEWLIRRSVWIIGGDGWAYDIGYGGLDHVLSLTEDVNILVLDTEVYSNTGGQTSKATPLGAIARFSAAGKAVAKKDLARIAMTYPHVYVGQVAFGAKDTHALKVFHEAEAYAGPSLIVAYSPCIAHGVAMGSNLHQQKLAVETGHWPLFRRDPRQGDEGVAPVQLDSPAPKRPLRDYLASEARFSALFRSHPQIAEACLATAQQDVDRHYAALTAMTTPKHE